MTAFILDQCLDAKRLFNACREEGVADLYRFPARLKNNDDDEVLNHCIGIGRALITKDRNMPDEWSHIIANGHPGIVVIAQDKPPTIRIKDVQAILRNFKTVFERWNSVQVINSVLEITDERVSVGRIENQTLHWTNQFNFTDPDWQVELERVLAENLPSPPGLPTPN